MTIEEIDIKIDALYGQLSQPKAVRHGERSVENNTPDDIQKAIAGLRAERARIAGSSTVSFASFRKA